MQDLEPSKTPIFLRETIQFLDMYNMYMYIYIYTVLGGESSPLARG